MELQTLIDFATPFVQYFSALIVSGVGVAYVTELLKSPKVKGLPVSKYPRTAAAVLAVIATFISIYAVPAAIVFATWYQVAAFALGTLVVSAFYYKQLIEGLKLTANSK
jgi:hypothetical protein